MTVDSYLAVAEWEQDRSGDLCHRRRVARSTTPVPVRGRSRRTLAPAADVVTADDHGHNHAAFVIGDDGYELTPAHDIAPQPRAGETARHPRFGEGDTGRDSRIAALVDAAPIYHLSPNEGQGTADHQVAVIRDQWDDVCEVAGLTQAQRDSLMGGPILNPHVFYR